MLAPSSPPDCFIIEDVNIVRLGPGDAEKVVSGAELFDRRPDPDATARFLTEPGHHLLFAYDGDVPVGFITGVETVHPDKGTEMFLYELGVAQSHRRRGAARALIGRLTEIARAAGCYGMWVATEVTNVAALATYEAAGAKRDEEPAVILTWTFDASGSHL